MLGLSTRHRVNRTLSECDSAGRLLGATLSAQDDDTWGEDDRGVRVNRLRSDGVLGGALGYFVSRSCAS